MAAEGSKLPPEAAEYEQLAWYRIRELRRMKPEISYQVYERCCQDIRRRFVMSQGKQELFRKRMGERVAFWARIELAANRYAKERTREAADIFYNQVYGFMNEIKQEDDKA